MSLKPSWIGWKECVVVALFVFVLLLPLLFHSEQSVGNEAHRKLVIVTPHNEQIRYEFKFAFEDWHEQMYGDRVDVVWSVPGGTSEIRRMLLAQWTAAIEQGRQPGGDADLVFGGGSYEHSRLKDGATKRLSGLNTEAATQWLIGIGVSDPQAAMQAGKTVAGVVQVEMHQNAEGDWVIDASAGISDVPPISLDHLVEIYGRQEVAGTHLWDPDAHWFGTALSSFGLVSNIDELNARGIDPPDQWADLADPRLESAVSMVNPAQSGSVTTAFETILQRLGWTRGWQILPSRCGECADILRFFIAWADRRRSGRCSDGCVH